MLLVAACAIVVGSCWWREGVVVSYVHALRLQSNRCSGWKCRVIVVEIEMS